MANTWLIDDFSTVLAADFGDSATWKSLSAETYNTDTGAKSKTEAESTIIIVPGTINVQDVQQNPNIVKIAEIAVYTDEQCQKGDTLRIDSQDWLVVESKTIQNMKKLFLRRA